VTRSDTDTQPAPPTVRKRTSFAGDVLKLASGATLAQVLSVLVSPIIARFYAPDAFGTAAVFNSIVAIISVVACLRYELAIMLPKRDKDAANLLAVSLLSVLVFTGLSVLLVLFAQGPIVRLLKAPDLAPYLWLIPLAVLANGGFLAFNYWNSRTKHFGRLSIARVSRSVMISGFQLAMGIIGQAHTGGLIGSRVLSPTIVTVTLGWRTWRDDWRIFAQSVRWSRMLEWAKRHRKFPLLTSWSALLNTASWQLPSLLLSFFFSSSVVGYYALGNRMVRLPMSLIGGAISQVFFQRASAAQNADGNLASIVLPLFRRLVAFGLFPALLLTVIAQDVFMVIFGPRWSEAGVYTQILSPWMFFVFISSPLSTLFSVLERQKSALLLNTLLFVTRLVSLGTGGILGNARLALVLFAATGIFIYGGSSIWILRTSGVPKAQIFNVLSRYLGFSVLVISPVAAIKFSLPASALVTVIAAGIACVVYFILLSREEQNLIRWIRQIAIAKSKRW